MSDSRDADPGETPDRAYPADGPDAGGAFEAALTSLAECVDALLDLDFAVATPAVLVDFAREWEVQQRRMVVVTHGVVAGLGEAGVAGEFGYRDVAALLADVLRLSPGEARARQRAASDFGPRRSLLGEPLAPQFEQVAEAQLAGAISPAHANVIVKALDTLSPDADVQHADRVQAVLVEHARGLNPAQLGSVAVRVLAYLDPDGRVPVEAEQQRRRDVTLTSSPDQSGVLRGRLTPELLAVLQTVLDSLSVPAPGIDGTPDPRTPDLRSPGQRRHDALLDACHRLLRDGDLPPSGGVPTTLILTMSADDFVARRGFATTVHGGLIPAADTARLADQADVYTVALTATGGILDYGRTRRTASPAQRVALIARDRGCTFPGCTVPPTWTQAHHVTEWQHHGPTATTNLTLLCGHHHRTFTTLGWTVAMRDGTPWWTPPPHLDPHQKPTQNHYWRTPQLYQ